MDMIRNLDPLGPARNNDDLLGQTPMEEDVTRPDVAPTQDDAPPDSNQMPGDSQSTDSVQVADSEPSRVIKQTLVLHTKSYPHMHMGDLNPVIVNVVGMCNSGPDVRLDLKSVSLRCKNAEYHPKRFSAVVLRIREPRCTALCFESAKIIVTGASSVENAKLGARKICKILKKLDQPVKFLDFKIQNMVAVVHLHRPICLENFAHDNADHASYEPELFPAVIFHMVEPKVCCLLFVTGKMVVTGAKSKENIFDACEKMYPLVRRYFKRVATTDVCSK